MKWIFTLILPFLTAAYCGELVVVASKRSGIEQLTKHQLKEFYLKKRLFIGDKKIVTVNLPALNHSRIIFDRLIINMDADNISEHWNQLHYNGVNPPIVQNSFDGVKALVKKIDTAIGYIDSDSIDEGLKVVAVVK